jgi:DNA replication and repair protein RecF
VEHDYIATWRAYKTALKQRNAALKAQLPNATIEAWDDTLIKNAISLDIQRKTFISDFKSQLSLILSEIFPFALNVSYSQGWKEGDDFKDALTASFPRDRVMGATQVGPHRADLKLRIDGQAARHRLSRGQQKLLGAALILAQTHFVANAVSSRIVLLVDDPAAELDEEHQEHLFRLLQTVPAQLFITSLDSSGANWENNGKTFAIEAGNISHLV